MSDQHEYLTTAEVADLVRATPETLRYWRHRGTGPTGFKRGRRVIYARREVERWLRSLQEVA